MNGYIRLDRVATRENGDNGFATLLGYFWGLEIVYV